nr:tRNA preQ1(34) S-adenosylmethionine ribosyltransferase-isomerase QueA [Formicincola oecophyllae]
MAPFDFDLPKARIALSPARPRDQARLLHVQGGQRTFHHVRDLPGLLRPGDLLIVNDTAVLHAKLAALRVAERGTAHIGLTLDRPLADGSWHVLARNARKLRPGDNLRFEGSTATATVLTNEGDGAATLRFSVEGASFDHFLETCGVLALPPYIDRPNGPTADDERDYTTLFAAHKGAVAAPTAGLHFTPELMAALAERGVERHSVTLHVGAGTFLPVRGALADHKMHSEWGHVSAATANAVNKAHQEGRRVVAVGTTSLRLLESACQPDGTLAPWRGETDIFIKPGYRFRCVDALMTNFHLPRSTLFMLVCAFAGTEPMRAAYSSAIEAGMRFYSYGDACLLEKAPEA